MPGVANTDKEESGDTRWSRLSADAGLPQQAFFVSKRAISWCVDERGARCPCSRIARWLMRKIREMGFLRGGSRAALFSRNLSTKISSIGCSDNCAAPI